MDKLLQSFAALPDTLAWPIFLIENLLLTVLVLIIGRIIQRRYDPQAVTPYAYSRREWLICAITNVLNTVVTYAGYWLWKQGIIVTGTSLSWVIPFDFLFLFLAMDLLMYIFHFLIHKTVLYKIIHSLHHEAVHPKPMDLFILHPIETLSFGALWLILLVCYPFNIWAIIIYLIVNLVFGLTGHLGIEPLPAAVRRLPVLNILGTSTFHHDHHADVSYNFGFYTNLWDRLFGTWKQQ
ncbi:sterol desaturase family protein [Paraflavitalea sp. CAU 1676]|uniref:sterol desaturase family protein n=1 Tax=Paraflavitalea sp. CAU 1676 TaxID=3032598 RepID=UPI0023DCE33F|nr:sterol desaturase family protein [Paraflavitalea sp. CAU 1676]MDF2190337.1 sterol desaturase family protein [Paraflavitalea sp. CAU 1676]